MLFSYDPLVPRNSLHMNFTTELSILHFVQNCFIFYCKKRIPMKQIPYLEGKLESKYGVVSSLSVFHHCCKSLSNFILLIYLLIYGFEITLSTGFVSGQWVITLQQ